MVCWAGSGLMVIEELGGCDATPHTLSLARSLPLFSFSPSLALSHYLRIKANWRLWGARTPSTSSTSGQVLEYSMMFQCSSAPGVSSLPNLRIIIMYEANGVLLPNDFGNVCGG